MKFPFAKPRKKLKVMRKWLKKRRRGKSLPFQGLKFDRKGCHRSPIDLKSKWRKIVKVQPYEAMLWSFYEEHAITRFERIARERRSVGELVQANWALARWHWSKGRFEKALSLLSDLRRSLPEATWPEEFFSFEARTLSHLARADEALGLVSGDSAQMRLDRFAILRQADHDADGCLALINAIYREKNLAPIERRDQTQPLSISNLTGEVEPDPRASEALVSIVMPAFEAEETIGFAIEGILRQSWTNIELIIVDDASQDATWNIVREHARSDPRIVLIRQPENRGAYAARNAGLHEATGRFVTINDADDWSHPERIALQAKAALDDGVTNITYGARVIWDLQLNRVGRYLPLLNLNISSILYERSTALDLNGWDLTRFAADSEFRHRYEQHVGSAHRELLTDTPMAWLLADENSLTQSSVTGLRSLQFGARQQYREAYRDWHAQASSLCLGETRPFPVPRIALKKNPDPIVCDELLISDFCKETSVEEELRAIKHVLAKQRRTALLHLPRLGHFNKPIDERIRRLIHDHAIPVAVPGENVISASTTLLDSGGLEYLPTPKTSVATKAAYISTTSFAKLSSSLGEMVAKRRIIDVVNNEPKIVDDGSRDHLSMHEESADIS